MPLEGAEKAQESKNSSTFAGRSPKLAAFATRNGPLDHFDPAGRGSPLRRAQGEEPERAAPPYREAELLALVRQEMERSVGFENDQILLGQRLRALDLYKGDMRAEIPSLPNRSRAVSTDVADAVETILPELMEMFVGGGDVASFVPVKPGDEAPPARKANISIT